MIRANHLDERCICFNQLECPVGTMVVSLTEDLSHVLATFVVEIYGDRSITLLQFHEHKFVGIVAKNVFRAGGFFTFNKTHLRLRSTLD